MQTKQGWLVSLNWGNKRD